MQVFLFNSETFLFNSQSSKPRINKNTKQKISCCLNDSKSKTIYPVDGFFAFGSAGSSVENFRLISANCQQLKKKRSAFQEIDFIDVRFKKVKI